MRARQTPLPSQQTSALRPEKLDALEQSHRDALELRRAIASKTRSHERTH